ncbi:MAG: PEP-CTERM sorting domain-containing protein [Verrucomicrobiota bacterium]
MAGVVLGVAAQATLQAATLTWDGGGANDQWGTAGNWDPASAPNNGDSVIFDGTTRLTISNAPWGRQLQSVAFASDAGAFTVNGGMLAVGSGGITNNSTNTQTINSRIELSANQTWNAANGAIISNDSYFNATNKNLTLTGGSTITIAGQVANAGILTLAGSGNRNFTSTTSMSATTVDINNTGTNTFSAQVNATTLNLTAGTSYFNKTGTSAQIGSGGVNIGGTANATFAGNVGSSGGYNITSSGDINFAGNITSGALTLNGTGTTTLSGNGGNSISSTTVNSGTLVMAQTGSGDAINGPLVVNGGSVVFEGDGQIPTWTSVTLNDGAVFDLGDTVQEFTNLIVNGNAIIDFGTGGSELDITNITLNGDSVLTILNWNDSLDSFFANYDPGSSSLAQVIFDGYGEATWDPYDSGGFITPGTPVPEPAAYGLMFVGGLLGLVLNRRQTRPSPVRLPGMRPAKPGPFVTY